MADDAPDGATAGVAAPVEQGRRRGGWLPLIAATLLLTVALVYALTRQDQGAVPAGTDAAPAANAAGAPDMAALEERTRANPNDAAAWAALGQARFDAELYAPAVEAYARATRLAPGVAATWSAYGEAQVMASRVEPMPAGALAAFRRAAELDADDPRARYFLAVKRDLEGDHEGAIRDWLALLGDTPRGAPWEDSLRRTIEQVGRINNIDVAQRLAAVRQPAIDAGSMPVAARAIPGPTAGQMQDAAALPKGQQDAMAREMVDRLEQRLAADPRQPDRWIMLMRSRMTLGEPQRAAQALASAVATNPDAADRLRAEARLLQVPGT